MACASAIRPASARSSCPSQAARFGVQHLDDGCVYDVLDERRKEFLRRTAARPKASIHAEKMPCRLAPSLVLPIALLGCSQPPAGGTPIATEVTGTDISDDGNEPGRAESTGGDGDSGVDTDGATDDGSSNNPDLPTEPLPDPDAPAKLFSHDYLPVYRITMQGSNWAEAWQYLLAQLHPNDKCADRPYSEITLEFENPWTGETEHYEQVGFRIRGHDVPAHILEQPDERFGFKMSFATFMQGRRFHGHKQVNFLSSEHDDTLMKQCLMYDLMRDFDIPAAWCNFAAVYVNDDYVGVFAHVEARNAGSYLKNRFPDDSNGSLYEFGDCWGDSEDALIDLGPDVAPYVDTYQLEAGTEKADVSSDLIPFLQCASMPDPEFMTCIQEHIDIGEWHRAIATHLAIPEMDGWAPSSSNFLLYHYGPQGSPRRFVVYPWDVDRAFKDDCDKNDGDGNNHTGACHILGHAWEDGVSPELVNRLREPPFRSDYCATVQAFVDQHFNPTAMTERMNALRDLPRVAAKPFEGLAAPSLAELLEHDPLWDLARFDDELDAMLEDKLPSRHAALLEQLAECELSPLIEN
jgi:hypothetical protein